MSASPFMEELKAGFHAQEGRLEQRLGVAEVIVANGHDMANRQLKALLQGEEDAWWSSLA